MKKERKRVLAFFMALVMITTSVPIDGQAASKKKEPKVTKLTLNYSKYVIKKGKSIKLKTTVKTDKKTKKKVSLRWSSSNPSVAIVKKNGRVKALKEGKATIRVKAGKNAAKAMCKIIVGTPVKKLLLDAGTEKKLKVGEVSWCSASVSPSNASIKKLTYKSSNKSVVKVGSKGKIKAMGVGKAKITIATTDGSKKKKVILVTVTQKESKPTPGATSGVADTAKPGETSGAEKPENPVTDRLGAADTAKPGETDGTEKPGTPVTDKPGAADTAKPEETSGVTEIPSVEPTQTGLENQKFTITVYGENGNKEEIQAVAGTPLKDTKIPFAEGKVFLGWFYDSAFQLKVPEMATLQANVSLYAKYADATPFSEDGSPNYVAAENQKPDFSITVDVHSTTVSADDVKAALKLTNVSTPSRTSAADALEKDELEVASIGAGKFTVKAVNGYQEGATYQLEIIGSDKITEMNFEGQDSAVIYYNFTIVKSELLNLSLDSGVKYLSVSALSSADAEKIMSYQGLYKATQDASTGEVVYVPNNQFGTFTYDNGNYIAGDIIAVYEGTKPDERTLDTSLDEGVSYIEITKVEGNVYSYKSADASDVLFTPDIIPIDIDAGDGVTGYTETGKNFVIQTGLLDFTTGYDDMGLDYATVVEPGDYVAFYSGEYGKDNAITKGYGKITSVTKNGQSTTIVYETVTYEEVMASMDVFKNSDLTKKQLDAIDEQQIRAMVKEQVLQSGFAQEAGMYLATMAVETDEVQELAGVSKLSLTDCILSYDDGTKVSGKKVQQYLKDNKRAVSGTPVVSVGISKELEHFETGSGFRVEVALKYGFDIQKQGSKQKIAIEMTAIFETEVLLGFSADGGAVWKKAWIFPYIYDYKMTGNIDQGLYTGIAITATAQLDEEDDVFGPELLEPEGLDDYAQKIVDLSESIKQMMEASKKDEAGIAGTASGALLEKYERFVSDASDKWIDLVSVPIFSAEGSLDPFYVTAYSINVDFVISANMSVAIGMSFQYEKSQRHTFTMLIFHRNESTSKTVDLSTERYQFDFYVMGTLGIRAGIRAKVLFGLFSTKLAGVGLQLEAGAYARLWGYFYYCLSWEKGKGKESSATGAMLIEIGAYLDLNLAMEVLNGTFSYNPSLLSKEWPIWYVGEQNNVLDFAYDEEGKWTETKKGKEYSYEVPTEFAMVKEKTLKLPAELFRMKYMDLKEGGQGYATYDTDKRAASIPSSDAYEDEEKFYIEFSNPAFHYNPETNEISVVSDEGKYSYEGTMTITWKQASATYSNKPISKTFNVSWVDPESGNCLAFETKGGTVIKTKVYGPGADIKEEDIPADPSKIGYEFGGWYSDEACTKATSVPRVMPETDVTLYAKWIPAPNEYAVKHYYEKLDGTYVLDKTTVQQDNVYTDDLLKENEVIKKNGIIKTGFEAKKVKGSESVAPDGSSVVAIYYNRQIHPVTFSMGELESKENPAVTINYRYEESIVVPTYFMYGYTFEGWDKEVADTMGIETLSYTAKWKANENTPYYLEYYVKNPSTGEYVMMGGENGRLYKEGTTGATVDANDFQMEDAGYTLDKIMVNGVTGTTGKIDPYGKLLISYYYEGVPYSLTFDANGGTIEGKVPESYVHGVPLSLTDITAKRTGYNFIGWLEGDNAIKEISANRLGNITLTAEWRAVKREINLYDADGSTSLGMITATYGRTVPSLAKVPEKNGYDFAGFSDENGTVYYDASGNGMVVWEQEKDINLKASWTPKKVEVNLDTNGGDTTLPVFEGVYLGKYSNLPMAQKEGYTFLGWMFEGASDGSYVTVDTTIKDYNTHALVAKWKAREDTPYSVEIYVESSGSGYELFTVYQAKGTTGENVSVENDDYKIAGYTFNPSDINSVLSGVVKADGSTVLKKYYKKGQVYKATFVYGQNIETSTRLCDEGEIVDTPYFNGTVGENMVLAGWKCDGVFYKQNTSYQMTTKDVEFTAVWKKNDGLYSAVTYVYDEYDRIYQEVRRGDAIIARSPYKSKYPEVDEAGNITHYYEFVNWNTEADGSGDTYEPGDELEGSDSFYLYPQWEKKEVPEGMVPYYVVSSVQDSSSMYVNGQNYWLMFGKEGEKTKAEALTLDYVTPQEITQKTIVFGEDADNEEIPGLEGYTVVIVTYDRDSYDIVYDYNGGSYDGESTKTESYVLGESVYGTDEPIKNGFEFVGWDVEIPTYMPGHDIHAVAQYRPITLRNVKVEYYTENLDGTYDVTPNHYEVLQEISGESVRPVPIVLDGFETPEAKEITVADDGSSVCQYYYKRKEFNLSWNAGEGTITDTGYSEGAVKFGEKITEPQLEREGYTGSWKKFTGTMPAEDICYEAKWTPKKVVYNIQYRKQNIDGKYDAIASIRREEYAETEITVAGDIPDAYADQVAEGYKKPLEQTVKVAGDGSTVVHVDYTLLKSHLYYDFSGATLSASAHSEEKDYYYGTTIQLPRISNLKRTGYTIIGWYDASDSEQTILDSNTATITDKDVTYKLKCEPVTYTIAYDLTEEDATNENNVSSYQTGFTFNISGAKCEGMAFAGWEWAGTGSMPKGVKLLENGLVHITKEAEGNLKFKAKWITEYKEFVATYYEGSTDIYWYNYPKKQESTITLEEIPEPVREGYRFAYWSTKSPNPIAGYDTKILSDNKKVCELNINTDFLTANWMRITKRADGYYNIHVTNSRELEKAAEIINKDSDYKGIVLDNDIIVTRHNTPYFEKLESDMSIVSEGATYRITFEDSSAPLVEENYGYINRIEIQGSLSKTYDTSEGETYFGSIANKNYGIIENCSVMYTRTETNNIRTSIISNADYLGAVAGYNEGRIKKCYVNSTVIMWDDLQARENATGYVGTYVGWNAQKGDILDCYVDYVTVRTRSGYVADANKKLYIGGVAGISQGKIKTLTIVSSAIGSTSPEIVKETYGSMCAGGVVGMDAVYLENDASESEMPEVRKIEDCKILYSTVQSETTAGGVIGELNYGTIGQITMREISVYGGDMYAGQIAGCYRTTQKNSAEMKDIYGGKTTTKTGKAGIVAGLLKIPNGKMEEGAFIYVRLRDARTKEIINGVVASHTLAVVEGKIAKDGTAELMTRNVVGFVDD